MNILMPVFCFLAAFLLLAGVNRIELRPWLKSEGGHWAERSRVLWPARRTNSILLLYVPLLIAAGSKLLADTSLLGLIPRWLAASLGAVGAGWFVVKKLYPEIGLRPWLLDVLSGWFIRLGFWMVLAGAGFSMPTEFNRRAWLTLAAMMGFQVAWPFISLHLLRLVGILRPAGERLRKIVVDCTPENGPKVRSVWQASGVTANAMALTLSGSLIFMDTLLDNLTDEEVASICSHELGHLAESTLVLIGRYIGGMSTLPLLAIRPAMESWELPGFIAMIGLMVVWSRLSTTLINRMETRADAVASGQQSGDGVYARALEKLYQINHMPAVMPAKLASHPHLYDRMLAAEAPPGFPRPDSPEKFTPLGWLMLFGGPFGLMWILGDLFR